MKPLAKIFFLALLAGALSSWASNCADSLRAELAKWGPGGFTSSGYKPGLVRHIVLFRYKTSVTAAQKEEVKTRFLALAKQCVRNGVPYIESIETGSQNSGEGVDQDLEQAFVVTFRSEGDRNFYVGQPILTDPHFYDPAHQSFKDFVGPLLHDPINPSGVLVFDYAVSGRSSADGEAQEFRNWKTVRKFFANYALIGDWPRFQSEQSQLLASDMATVFIDRGSRKIYGAPSGYFQSLGDWAGSFSTGPDFRVELVLVTATQVVARLHGTLGLKTPYKAHTEILDSEHSWTETFTLDAQGQVQTLKVEMNIQI